MKYLSILFLMLAFVSCQKQQSDNVNKAKQVSIDSMKTEISKQQTIDSMKLEIANIKKEKERPQNVTVINHPASTNNTTTTTAIPAKRKGWSRAAKGAVIGAGVGAITGAVISKKKGEGAIIGGLAGAGLGAGTGAILDDSKKNKK